MTPRIKTDRAGVEIAADGGAIRLTWQEAQALAGKLVGLAIANAAGEGARLALDRANAEGTAED